MKILSILDTASMGSSTGRDINAPFPSFQRRKKLAALPSYEAYETYQQPAEQDNSRDQ